MKEEDNIRNGEGSSHHCDSEASESGEAPGQPPHREIDRDVPGPQADAEDEEAEARADEFWGLTREILASAPRTSTGHPISDQNDGSRFFVNSRNSLTLHPPVSLGVDPKRLLRRFKNRLPLELVEYIGPNAFRWYPLEELCERFFWYVGILWANTVYFGDWDGLPHSIEVLRDRMLIDAANGSFQSLDAQRPSGETIVSAAPIDVIRALLLRGYYIRHALDCVGFSGRLVARMYKEHKERTSGTSAEERNKKPEQDPAAAEQCLEKPEEKAQNEMRYDRACKKWHFIFKGKRLPEMKHCEGLWYLAQILNHPNELMSSHDLRQARLNREIPASQDIDTVTVETVRNYRHRHIALEVAIEEEKAKQNFVLVKEHQTELEELQKQLSRITDRYGMLRSSSPELEKSRKLVSNNIKNALNKIEEMSEELAAHLRSTIFLGQMIIYIPEENTSFEIFL